MLSGSAQVEAASNSSQECNMKRNILLAIVVGHSMCACAATQLAAPPIATPPSALNDKSKLSTLATLRADLEVLLENDKKLREGYKPRMILASFA